MPYCGTWYCRAVFGKGLDADLRGEGGRTSIGGQKANLTGNVLQYATEIGGTPSSASFHQDF